MVIRVIVKEVELQTLKPFKVDLSGWSQIIVFNEPQPELEVFSAEAQVEWNCDYRKTILIIKDRGFNADIKARVPQTVFKSRITYTVYVVELK